MYLPGIGEAIGGAIRMKRQGELMAQSQKILQDDTKPWSERVALVTAAHPELATNPQLQQMLEVGRQADLDKRENAKYQREIEAAASGQRFKDLLAKTPAEQQRALILNNPDMAASVVPEQLKIYQGEQARIDEEDRWLRRNEITSGQKDRRAAVAAGAQSSRDTLNRYLAGQMDAAGNLISPAQQAATKQEQELSTAGAKTAQVAQAKQAEKTAALDDLTVGLTEYRDILSSEGRTGGFGADAAELEALRMSLGVKLAQADNPGRAPTDADVKVAMERIPETGFMTSPTSAIAQVDRLIKDAKGFKAGQADKPAAKKGFTPAPGSIR